MNKRPNDDWLGTRVNDEYQWLSWKDSINLAKFLSFGIEALNLADQIEVEGRVWKFLGIKSKNCKEWLLMYLANMH
jgi:hypothetical protein